MNPAVFTWIVYALWIILVIYLTVSAVGVTRDTQGHLGQSFGLLAAIIASFLLPRLSIFRFLNFAPVNPGLSTIGIFLSVAGSISRLGAAEPRQELEPDGRREGRT